MQIGNEVRAVFGDTLDSEGHTINKLNSIRVCAPEDQECAADRVKQDQEQKELEQQQAASLLKHERCRQAMYVSLASDLRYVPESATADADETRSRFNALTGANKLCASNVLRQHRIAVIEACRLHHCGDNIGGGCSHIAGYAMTDAAIERAVAECGK